jgi:nucleoid DNA-binding protein
MSPPDVGRHRNQQLSSWQPLLRGRKRNSLHAASGRVTTARRQATASLQTLAAYFGMRKPLDLNEMTKQQLIEKVAAKTELGKAQVEVAVDSVFETIGEALRANERVDLRGFGSFTVKDRKERQGRNPRTGEAITIAAKPDASFKPGKELMEKLAQAETAPKTEEAA